MTRWIPLIAVIGITLGCGKQDGGAPVPPGGAPQGPTDPQLPGSTNRTAPPTPTPQQLAAYLPTLGRNLISTSAAPDALLPREVPVYELSSTATDADLRVIRDPGFTLGLKLISPNFTDAALATCGKLPSLVSLSVTKTKSITSAGVAELTKLKHLAVLQLLSLRADNTWLAALKPLTGLRKLDLEDNINITDAGLAHLSGMTQLRELRLGKTKVTGSGLASLANAKELSRVVLPEQTDAALKALAKIGKLYALEEALTEPEHRPKSDAEVVKFIVRGPVTDAGLKEVKAFPNLTHLYLRGDKITTASIPFLKSLKKLKHLEHGMSLTQEQLDDLKAALPGCEVR